MDNRDELTPIISMWMPWANWVGLGWKTIETRTHQRFRGLVGKRIGIHCALKWDKGAIEAARPYLDAYQVGLSSSFLKIGGAVCWTALATEHRQLEVGDEFDALIECRTVRFGLVLTDVQRIEAIPMRGHQGIWYAQL